MTPSGFTLSLATLYRLTALAGVSGALAFLLLKGPASAAAFALGALCSAGNLWLFDWLSRRIAPNVENRKPWRAGAFATRYLLLLSFGYAIVKGLGVSPLAVILGLCSSALAALVFAVFELAAGALKGRTSH